MPRSLAWKRELFTHFALAAVLFLAVLLQITFCKSALLWQNCIDLCGKVSVVGKAVETNRFIEQLLGFFLF